MDPDVALQLTNSGYLENQTRYYNELLESQEMSDVTLACDGYEVGAHKTIISGSSQFFKEVIRKSKHVNPYIYIKGVSKETLETVLKFIYAGEATARTDNLEKLVDAGNELKVFGLMKEPPKKLISVSHKKQMESYVDINTDSVGSGQLETNVNDKNVTDFVKIEHCELEEADGLVEEPPKASKRVSKKKHMESSVDINTDGIGSGPHETSVNESKDESDSARLRKEINDRITTNVDDLGNKSFKCNVCQREFATIGYARPHIETHLEGFSHKCKFCDVVKRTRKMIHYHQNRYHITMNNGSNVTEKHNEDNEESKTTTETELDMDVVSEEEVKTADAKVASASEEEDWTGDDKVAKKHNEDKEEGKTETEKDMNAVYEELDRTADRKVTKNLVIGEIVDDSNRERFEEELESLMITGGTEGNILYECKMCQKVIKKKAYMKLHAEIHMVGFSHKCKYCETVKKTMRSIQLHEWDQHRRNATDNKTKELIV